MDNPLNSAPLSETERDSFEEKIRTLQMNLKKARTSLRETELKEFFSQKIIAQQELQINKHKSESMYLLFKFFAFMTKIKRSNELEKKFKSLENEKGLLQKRIEMLIRSSNNNKDIKTALTPRENLSIKSIDSVKTQPSIESTPKPRQKTEPTTPNLIGFDYHKSKCSLGTFTKESSVFTSPLLSSLANQKQNEISDLISSLSSRQKVDRARTFSSTEAFKKN